MMLSKDEYFEVDAINPMQTRWQDGLGQFAADLRDGFGGATNTRSAATVGEAELFQDFSRLVFGAAKRAEELTGHARVN